MAQVARELTNDEGGFLLGKTHLLLDRDTKFTEAFRQKLQRSGIESVRLLPRSPNLNVYAERCVRSIKDECLDRLILFGPAMLRCAVTQYVAHYYTESNHQGLGNRIINPGDSIRATTVEIACRQRVDGFLKRYHRRVA